MPGHPAGVAGRTRLQHCARGYDGRDAPQQPVTSTDGRLVRVPGRSARSHRVSLHVGAREPTTAIRVGLMEVGAEQAATAVQIDEVVVANRRVGCVRD